MEFMEIPMDSPPIPKMNLPAIISSILLILTPHVITIYPIVMNDRKIIVIFLYPAYIL